MFKIKGIFVTMAVVLGVSACGVDPVHAPAPGEDPARAQPGESTASSEIAANCSVVEWCNAPGSEGTVCRRQQGCTVQESARECLDEVQDVCGAVVQRAIFITLDNHHRPWTESCILSNSCGGQAPAGCFCDSLCTLAGDCCFDMPC